MNSLVRIARKHYKRAIGTQRHVCLLFSKKRIHHIGVNLNKTHPVANTAFGTLHAETHAIVKAKKKCGGLKALVLRFSAAGRLRMSKPC